MLRSIARPVLPIAFAALVLAPPLVHAQPAGAPTGSIAGRVTPAHDHDVVLATARIPDLGQETRVAADGTFRFAAVRPGSYLVEVRVPSLGVVAERVAVRAGEETAVEFVLVPGSHSEEIVVTASADARDPYELATPTTSLSGQELAMRLESSLGETLAQEPGITSSFFGPGASRPIIRGLSGDRVRMLEGGIGTGDASGVSADHAVTADPAQAEWIEVVRGPATLLYGSSAVGGVVNVIDERIPTVRGADGVHGSVEARAGTGSDERHGSVMLGGGAGGWAWNAGAVAREAGDYEIPGFARLDAEPGDENPRGFVPNSDLEARGGRFGATYFFGDRGYFGAAVSGFTTEYGLPGGVEHGDEEGEEEEEEEEGPVRIDMDQRRFDLRGRLAAPFRGFEALKLRLGLTDYEHVELEGTEVGTRFFNDFLETRIELVQATRGRVSGSLGFQYADRDLDAIGDEAFLPATATERWALFTLQEIDAGPLHWQLGARFETQDVSPRAAAGRSHDGLSASLGLVWNATETFSIAASAARSVKLPAAEELFSNGLHVATQAFEIGDPALGEEIGFGLDLSFRVESHRVSGELTLFRQGFDDFIFQAFTGDEEEGFPVVLYAQRDATFRGAELKTRIELVEREGRHLHLSLMGDVVDAELDRGGNLPRIPPLRLGGGLHYHSERWNASTELRWVDAQTDVAVNETPTAGYTLWNVSAGYRFLLRDRIVDLLLRGRNLGDDEARAHTSFLKNVAPLPGRNVTLSVKLQF